MASLEEELTCPVCRDTFGRANPLPCGHSLCPDCVRQAWSDRAEGRSRSACPQCEEGHGEVPCDCCPADAARGSPPSPALKTCLRCEVSLCAEHLRPHLERPAFAAHPLVDPLGDLSQRRCPTHGEMPRYYCADERAYVCGDCLLDGGHAQHKVRALREVEEELKVIVQTLLTKAEEKLQNGERILKEHGGIGSPTADPLGQDDARVERLGSGLRVQVGKLEAALREIARGERRRVEERVREDCSKVRADVTRTLSIRRYLSSLLAETDPFLLVWMAYRRDVGYFHQPVQGFDYAKQHLGQQGGNEEGLPDSQDTLVMSLKMRDTSLSVERSLQQDGTANKKNLTADKHRSNLPSEDSSVISNESEKLKSSRGLAVLKVTAQQKLTKRETRKRDDPYDTSSGSLQLISIKPVAAQPNYSCPASSDRDQESAIVNREVNLALKQKSDIEHYRNKLRLKAKRKGYYDFPSTDSSSGQALAPRQRRGHERAAGEHGRPLEPDDERGSTFVKSHRRHSQVGPMAYRSRQSLSCPSPGGTEMDMLVMRERPRRGIRNSGYDTEPELVEETNVDRLIGPRGHIQYGRGLKGHSETSTLSSQPSIDEVRQQMHLLLEEAFSLASGGQSTSGRHYHLHHPCTDNCSHTTPPLPYADMVTSPLGSMTCGQGGVQWVPSYGADVYQCSLTKPAFHFTQLPEMAMSSPPLMPRTGPPPGSSLRRSTSDLGPQGRNSETSVTGSPYGNNPYGPATRAALPSITAEKPVSNYSGNPITAVYAIPATRPGYPEYFVSTPPTSYHSPSWMSYPPEPEDVPPQWADSLPLPGYVEAFPRPRYPQESPTRLPLQYNQPREQPSAASSTVSQQSPSQGAKDMDSIPLSSLSTSALVQAIRQEVAKLAKKQNDMFEF